MVYKKLQSIKRLAGKGLNVHNYVATKNTEEIKQVVRDFGYVCTIRTDSLKSEYKLPFYVIKDRAVDLGKICKEIESKDLLAIVTNGLRYDKHLRYNFVYTLERNGDFWIEYSKENCPLRKMYEKPMNCYIGNIDEGVGDWVVIRETDDRVDKREISWLLRRMWDKGIFGKYVEASIYNEKCGIYDEDIVFWQILNKSEKEKILFRLT